MFEFELGTDGSGMSNLIVQNGAFRNKFDPSEKGTIDESGSLSNNNYLYMNGPEIFNFTIANIPPLVNRVLTKNALSLENIDYASVYLLSEASKWVTGTNLIVDGGYSAK